MRLLLWMLLAFVLPSGELDTALEKVKDSRRRCGPTCVWLCLRQLGQSATLDEVITRSSVSDEGLSLNQILELCETFDARATALNVAHKDLATLPSPSILVTGNNQAVVFLGLNGAGRVTVFDPIVGMVQEFDASALVSAWTGETILFAPLGATSRQWWLVAGGTTAGTVFAALCAWVAARARQLRSRPETS